MKAQKFSLQKFQIILALWFATAILNFPVWAQQIKSMAKFYCPYCGMVNLMTSKFCSGCGARLPDPVLVWPSNGKQLAMWDSGKFMSPSNATSIGRDSLEEKIFNNSWNGPSEQQQTSGYAMAAAGLLGGTIGFFGGAYVGAGLASGCAGDFCGIGETIFGAAAGESLGIPLGVHLANGGRGNLLLEILASAGIGAAGLMLVIGNSNSADQTASIVTVAATPIVQLITSIAIERSTGRTR